MFDHAYRGDSLQARILKDEFLLKRIVKSYVHIAVDRSGDQKAAMRFVVRREVGTTAPKGDAQRRSRDDHRAASRNDKRVSGRSPPMEPASPVTTKTARIDSFILMSGDGVKALR